MSSPVLSKDTLIPLGVAVALIVPLSVGISWLRDGQKDNSAAIEKLRTELGYRFDTLEMQTRDRWTAAQMEVWTLRLQRENPALKIPDIR